MASFVTPDFAQSIDAAILLVLFNRHNFAQMSFQVLIYRHKFAQPLAVAYNLNAVLVLAVLRTYCAHLGHEIRILMTVSLVRLGDAMRRNAAKRHAMDTLVVPKTT
jgi:hypothetical protein